MHTKKRRRSISLLLLTIALFAVSIKMFDSPNPIIFAAAPFAVLGVWISFICWLRATTDKA